MAIDKKIDLEEAITSVQMPDGEESIEVEIDDTAEEQADYVGRTFGFYPTDVHPELQREEGQLVFPEEVPLPSDSTADIIETDLSMENLPYHSKRSMFPRDNKRIITGLVDPMPLQEDLSLDITVPLQTQEPLPFDDTGRETGIASLYGQGPSWAETDRRYEDEYRDYIARTGDRTTYEEFARAYERMHQGKPHAGLR